MADVILAGVLAGILALGAAPRADAATARIQYLSAGSVYLDAGSAAGLAEGMVLRVERGGKTIAELIVEFVAQNSASCRVQSSTETLRPNDVVHFTPPAATPAAPGAPPAPAAPKRPSHWSHRGRLGALFLRSSDETGRLDNPMLFADLAWNGTEQRQVALRFRGDRPEQFTNEPQTSPDPAEARVYEASLRYRSAGQRLEIEAGRLLPERLELLGSMDGGGLHVRPTRNLRFGIAGGGGTDYLTTGFATQGTKLGGFVEAGDGRSWRTLLALGRIDDPDVTRRQFVQVRSDASTLSRKLRLYENMEVDLAPDWKQDLGEDTVELTALSVGTQALVHRSFDFSLGYEARRALLVPEQRNLPSIDPRELFHSVRGSARFAFTRAWSLRLGGDVRLQSSGDVESRSWDALVYGSRVGPLSLSMHASVYDADQSDGMLLDGSLSFPVGTRTRFDFAGGGNTIQTTAGIAGGTEPESRWSWLRAAIGIESGFGLWLRGSGEWRSDDQGRELSVEITQQF